MACVVRVYTPRQCLTQFHSGQRVEDKATMCKLKIEYRDMHPVWDSWFVDNKAIDLELIGKDEC